jgi:hypothetical protein
MVSDGCHLNRRTGDAILAVTSSAGSTKSRSVASVEPAARVAPAAPFLFARVAPFERFSATGDQGEPALISPTVAGIAWKAST